ncbi:hypothetical protein SAMN04487761_11925 [Lachnospiraceae bacterium C7]|nr:hypothetical protein SAMN04487761_11925 [Lachnospiraceae bacterium C7]
MERTEKITRGTPKEVLDSSIAMGKAYMFPYYINESVWICMHDSKRAVNVFVTDVSVHGVQLSGAWYTWDEIKKNGGIYQSEFDALRSITM